MTKDKISQVCLVFCFLMPLMADGQSYFTAMGLRMGTDFGITLQQKIIGNFTAEGIVSSSAISNQTTGTLLFEIHNPLISKRFNFYIGGGVHQRWVSEAELTRQNLRGVTAIAGAEMTLGRINIAWDYKPLYHLNAEQQAFESETAVSLRYVFVRKIKGKKKPIFHQTPKQKRQKERKKMKKKKARGKKQSLKRERERPKVFGKN